MGQAPGRVEDMANRPFWGQSGQKLRQVVARYWSGPVALANACGCFPGRTEGGDNQPSDAAVEACRGFLAQTIEDVQPQRILAFGSTAIEALCGESPPVLSARRGYAWLDRPSGPVPVYFLMHPAAAGRNRFLSQWFERDVAWALTAKPPVQPVWDTTYEVVSSVESAHAMLSACRQAAWCAYDCETSGNPGDRDFFLLSLGVTPLGSDHTWVYDRWALALPNLTAPLRDLMVDAAVGKIGANIKWDLLSVYYAFGVWPQGKIHDVQLERHLLDPDAKVALSIMSTMVGMGGLKDESLEILDTLKERCHEARKREKKPQQSFGDLVDRPFHPESPAARDSQIAAHLWRVPELSDRHSYALLPESVLARRVARDALATARLGDVIPKLIIKVKKPDLQRTWDVLLARAPGVFAKIEAAGIPLDLEAVQDVRRYFAQKLDEIRPRFVPYAPFNPSSPEDKAKLLFDRLKLSCEGMTDSGKRSVDKEVLKGLRGKHPVVDDLIEWSRLSKLKSSYADSFPSYLRSDGRLHGDFRIDGARSGRLSMVDPAMQTVPNPKKSEDGRMIRRCLVAGDDDWVILEGDLAQVELRVAAGLSQDPLMCQIFIDGVDYHLRTAQMIAKLAWGIDPAQVTDGHRDLAKVTNFGILYGRTIYGLAYQLRCSPQDAEKIMDAIFGRFVVLKGWVEGIKRFVREEGRHLVWWQGVPSRHRFLHAIATPGDDKVALKKRRNAENAAVNGPVQGSANEFCLAAIIELVDFFEAERLPAQVILAVHDAIYVRVHKSVLDEVAWHMEREMTKYDCNGVKMLVDFKTGRNLGDLKKYQVAV